MIVVAAVVAAVGWYTAIQQVAYVSMISSIAFVALPFAVIAVGIPLCLVEIGAPLVEGGASAIKPYYRWLARRRHPVFWGVWMGVGIGGAILYAINAIVILPSEARNAEILADIRATVKTAFELNGEYPQPDDQNHLPLDDLHGANLPSQDGVVVDAFERPIVYELVRRETFARYRLTSIGFDGVPGGDDVVRSGWSKNSTAAPVNTDVVQSLWGRFVGRIHGLTARLNAIQSLPCTDQ